jgi:hypothetical protein
VETTRGLTADTLFGIGKAKKNNRAPSPPLPIVPSQATRPFDDAPTSPGGNSLNSPQNQFSNNAASYYMSPSPNQPQMNQQPYYYPYGGANGGGGYVYAYVPPLILHSFFFVLKKNL